MLEFKYIKNKYWQTFILSFLLAALLFLPISLRDAMQGYVFHYAGDYNNQSMLFWQYANQFVKDGGTFSWETDIGSSFVNSYSFPVLGSPFFWAFFGFHQNGCHGQWFHSFASSLLLPERADIYGLKDG